MKNKIPLWGLLAMLFLSMHSCDSNPCDEGYSYVEQNGGMICIPDFLVGIEKSIEYGSEFYHDTYGIIEFKEGKWINKHGDDITNKVNSDL